MVAKRKAALRDILDCDESHLPGSEPDCPACGAEPGALRFLGYLGDLEWFECKACGMKFSVDEKGESHED